MMEEGGDGKTDECFRSSEMDKTFNKEKAMMILSLLGLYLSCLTPVPQEFTCSCSHDYLFDDGSSETEEFEELFYCDETDEALDWVSTEVADCEEYASVGGESYTCDCSCDDKTSCS